MDHSYLFVVSELAAISLLSAFPQRQMLAGNLGDLKRFWLLCPRLWAIAGVNTFFAAFAQGDNQQTVFVRQQTFQFPAHFFHIAHRQAASEDGILQPTAILD